MLIFSKEESPVNGAPWYTSNAKYETDWFLPHCHREPAYKISWYSGREEFLLSFKEEDHSWHKTLEDAEHAAQKHYAAMPCLTELLG